MRNWRKSDNRLVKKKKKKKQQQVKDAVNFNKHRKPARQYQEGDLVRLARQAPHDGKSQKLSVKYQGPYRILKVLPNDRFVVEDIPMTRKKVEGMKQLYLLIRFSLGCRSVEN